MPVPKSMTKGSGSQGKAKATGLVPKIRSIPPEGATRACVLAVWKAMKPARAALST